MPNQMKDAIRLLEEQAKAIEKALSALRAMEGVEASAAEGNSPQRSEKSNGGRRRGTISEEGRERLRAAMKARWAKKKAAKKK